MAVAISGYDARVIRTAMTAARAQGQDGVDYLPDTLNVVGGAVDVPLQRKVVCRACNQPMPKGATATLIAYRFFPDNHPYRITDAFIHPERCR